MHDTVDNAENAAHLVVVREGSADMGYTTEFEGSFYLDKQLDPETHALLKGLSQTRRMARNIEGYGVEGEFYVDGTGLRGQDKDTTIKDYNTPPRTQPSLWCQWEPSEDGLRIGWNWEEKFYCYIEWIKYLIDSVLAPRGYYLSGNVKWVGEDADNLGKICIVNNKVTVKRGRVIYE